MNEIFTRISVRHFEEKEVDSEKVRGILQAGFSAPSALNQRPWEFFVVTNKETLKSLSKTSPYAGTVAKAPAAIVICYRKDIKAVEFAHIDCAIAAENILLELESLGLGGVFLAVAPLEERINAVKQVLSLSENLEPFNIIPFGYPKNKRTPKDRFEENRVHYIS